MRYPANVREPRVAGSSGGRSRAAARPARRAVWRRPIGSAGLALVGVGCAPPDDERIVRSPMAGVSIRAETFYGRCAVCSDNTNIYAVSTRAGREARQLILTGEYLQDAGYRWDGVRHLVICLTDGYTGEFHNEVTLETGDGAALRVHSSLVEDCAGRPAAAPAAPAGCPRAGRCHGACGPAGEGQRACDLTWRCSCRVCGDAAARPPLVAR